MIGMRLDELRSRLEADVVDGAIALLGADLVRGDLRARIVETEAYRAEDDPACHAFRGCTPRNQVMYGPAGVAYVYLNYGIHWMLNVVAHRPERAAAVLVRAAMPLSGIETMRERRPKARSDQDLLSGPGKLAAAFEITGADSGTDLLDPKSEIHLEPGEPRKRVWTGPRIGIAQGKGHEIPWRFVDAERAAWASRPRPESDTLIEGRPLKLRTR